MANDPDACVPQTLNDFVFDLYDSVTLSQLTEEQTRLYGSVFRELSAKYFANAPWPSPQSIASECNGDPLFLALYRELTHRHWHAVSRPTIRDRIEGWEVYRELFDEMLDAIEESGSQAKFFILPEWTFDILHEFVYQFQGFCQFRAAVHASATKHGLIPADTQDGTFVAPSGRKVPNHLIENLNTLSASRDAWAAETVLYYLHRLVTIGTNAKSEFPAYQYLGLFSSVTLSRLECLLADYTSCLSCITPIYESSMTISKADEDGPKTAVDVVHGVFAARLSLAYHAGVSFLMLRRYKDAANILGGICSYMQRGFKTGRLRGLHNSDQLFKTYDRMVALLAICTHICPLPSMIEEGLAKVIREKHGSQLGKEAYSEMFVYSAPKFVSPALIDWTQPRSEPHDYAYKSQLRHFEKEVKSQSSMRQLRSYLKLYTSISTTKLSSFGGNDPVDLLGYKLRMRQWQSTNKDVPSLKAAELKTALDIHYYLEMDTVHVDEAEKQRRFENYFLGQIAQNLEIRKDVTAIDTNV